MEISLNKKNIVIMGVANNFSIAWHIAQSLHKADANIIFTYVNERFKKNLEKLVDTLGKEYLMVECDVSSDESIENCFKTIGEKF